ELLSANYTFVNERLAQHYGMPNIYGSHFRRVTLDSARAAQRGGLFGQGSMLTVTSYPNRTSPVLRGKWVLTNILGTPPPPPPGDSTDRARVGVRELSVVGYHPWNREEHPLSDAEGGIMIVTKKAMNRRTVLRGIGTTLALPLLDSMVPALSALRETPANPIF